MPLGMEVGLGPGDIVLDGDPAPPSRKGAQQPSTFRPMSIVAKGSPISATTKLLSLVHGQVTIIFVVTVGLSVCLCRVFLSRL